MADGHVNWAYARACAQDRANTLTAIDERYPLAPSRPQRRMRANQERLGDADTGQVCQQPQVTRQAKTSGVGETLAIANNQVWTTAQSAQCGEYRRRLAKGQVSWHIRKASLASHYRMFQWLEANKIQHDHSRSRYLSIPFKADIDAGDATRYAQAVVRDHSATQ